MNLIYSISFQIYPKCTQNRKFVANSYIFPVIKNSDKKNQFFTIWLLVLKINTELLICRKVYIKIKDRCWDILGVQINFNDILISWVFWYHFFNILNQIVSNDYTYLQLIQNQ